MFLFLSPGVEGETWGEGTASPLSPLPITQIPRQGFPGYQDKQITFFNKTTWYRAPN